SSLSVESMPGIEGGGFLPAEDRFAKRIGKQVVEEEIHDREHAGMFAAAFIDRDRAVDAEFIIMRQVVEPGAGYAGGFMRSGDRSDIRGTDVRNRGTELRLHVENEVPENLRTIDLMDIGVHILQAVLKCGAVVQCGGTLG